jgi:dihydropteroate synthase
MTGNPGFINVRGNLIDLTIPKVMGIINVTPDSFHKASRFTKDEDIINAAIKMIKDGADILDIGGYSSRPGAIDIDPEEEKKRVLGALKLINREIPEAVLSIDTFRAEIAMAAVYECGAGIINDISGGEADNQMFRVVEKLQVPYILMHLKGSPWNMEKNPVYDDVVSEILKWLGERIFRLKSMGVNDVIIDPGFGFGKTIKHNFEILRNLGDFSIAGLPVLVGISRKSMIWKTFKTTPLEALNGTTVLNTIALMNGADILRVHDVKEAVEAVKLVEELKKQKN